MSKVTDGFEFKCQLFNPSFPYWSHDDGLELLAHARALEEMLRKHEFDGLDHHGDEVCIECRWTGHGDHAPDCALAKLLE